MDVSKTSDHFKIKIKIPKPIQEPTASSKAPNQDLKDMDVLCTFKIKIESQNFDHWCIKDQGPYKNQDQDAKHQSRTSSILQNPICKSKSICETLMRKYNILYKPNKDQLGFIQ